MTNWPSPSAIGILGGTGALGSGLAVRLARAGHRVILGSRNADGAQARAVDIARSAGASGSVSGASYRDAVAGAEVIFLTVPFASQPTVLDEVADELRGKILVDATVPLVPPKVSRVQLPPEGSSALAAQGRLGPEVTLVSAFQNVGAHHLVEPHGAIDCDVLVSSDSADARALVIGLVEDCGLRGWHAGPLANAAAAEALTSVLIFMNRHYKSDRAGIRITGATQEAKPVHAGSPPFAVEA